MLQWMREQILAEPHHQGAPRGGRQALTLPDSLHHVQLDLRDLMRRLQTLVLNTCLWLSSYQPTTHAYSLTHTHSLAHSHTRTRVMLFYLGSLCCFPMSVSPSHRLSLSSQLESVSSSEEDRTPADSQSIPPPLLHHRSAQTVWVRRLEVYVILRDLDLYLTKIARDLLLLDARHRGSLLGHPALQ